MNLFERYNDNHFCYYAEIKDSTFYGATLPEIKEQLRRRGVPGDTYTIRRKGSPVTTSYTVPGSPAGRPKECAMCRAHVLHTGPDEELCPDCKDEVNGIDL